MSRLIACFLVTALISSCATGANGAARFATFEDFVMTAGLNPNMCRAKNFCEGETRMSIEEISAKMGVDPSDWTKSADGAYIKHTLDFNDGMNMEVDVSSLSGNKLIFMGQTEEGYKSQH